MAEKQIPLRVKLGLLDDAELQAVRDRLKRVLARIVIGSEFEQADLDAMIQLADDHGALRGTLTVVKLKLVSMRDNPMTRITPSHVDEVLAVIERTEART
jgi:hypothetical protein